MRSQWSKVFKAPIDGRDGGIGLVDFLLFWQGIVAGLVVAGLCYAALMAAGFILGGEEAGMMLLNYRAHFRNLGAGNIIWIFLSLAISLFAGAYVGGRLCGSSLGRIAWIQSLVMTGMFILLLSWPVRPGYQYSTGFSTMVKSMFAYSEIHLWPEIQNPVMRVFRPEEFSYPYDEAINSISWALVRGKDQTAASTAVWSTRLPPAEVERRLSSIKAEFQRNLEPVKADTARMRMQLGLVLLGTLLLGAILSILGAEWGRRASLTAFRRVREPEARGRAAAA